jgi:hypothetical protein
MSTGFLVAIEGLKSLKMCVCSGLKGNPHYRNNRILTRGETFWKKFPQNVKQI